MVSVSEANDPQEDLPPQAMANAAYFGYLLRKIKNQVQWFKQKRDKYKALEESCNIALVSLSLLAGALQLATTVLVAINGERYGALGAVLSAIATFLIWVSSGVAWWRARYNDQRVLYNASANSCKALEERVYDFCLNNDVTSGSHESAIKFREDGKAFKKELQAVIDGSNGDYARLAAERNSQLQEARDLNQVVPP